MSHRPISSAEGLAAVARVRQALSTLPETEERIDKFGHTTFRVRNKPIVFLGENGQGCWFSVKADRHTQAFLLRRECFEKTPYIGQHGWTSVRWDRIPDWDEIVELIREAYLLVAPARLKKEMTDIE
ncbi:MAG: MmcQ/YjbR family DNA-binding protein [Gemmatimonadetes bacterium]|nr:MmcQ/YjbR family DNA-binding protein [Gemmatimonadota bacterium]